MSPEQTLAAQLALFMQELTDTIARTPDEADRERLLAQQQQVAAKRQAVIDEGVARHLAEYQAATKALNDSIKALKDTKADIAKVAKAIETVATVVNAVTKLAAMV
jgi:biotin-(acetyl-CoA carboxylase) ligase